MERRGYARGIHRVIRVSVHHECLPVHRHTADRRCDSCARLSIEHRFEISPAGNEICSRRRPGTDEERIVGRVTTVFAAYLVAEVHFDEFTKTTGIVIARGFS